MADPSSSGGAPSPRRSSRVPAMRRDDTVHDYRTKPATKAAQELDEKKKGRAKRVNRGLRRANTIFE